MQWFRIVLDGCFALCLVPSSTSFLNLQGRKKRPRLRSDTDVSSSNSESFGGFVFFELESNLPLEDVDAVDNPRRDTIPGSTTNGRRTSKGKVQREPIRFQKGELIGAGGFGQVFLGLSFSEFLWCSVTCFRWCAVPCLQGVVDVT